MVYKTEKKRECLCPTKQKIMNFKIHGFDIETYNKNMQILMTSVHNADGYDQVFIRSHRYSYCLKYDYSFRKSIISATNLAFDFFGSFFQLDDVSQFHTLFRGSSLLFAKTYIYENNFIGIFDNDKRMEVLKFLDTMNFAPSMGVKKSGELLNIPKLDAKEIIGQVPKDSDEWCSMFMYNIRDSEISAKFMIFLKESFEKLGATFKDTIAATSMSLYRNKYLDKVYFLQERKDIIDIFKAYYGGRTEVFKRGMIGLHNSSSGKPFYYFDINNLYGSVMRDFIYPDPNSYRCSFENSVEKIHEYEGVSEVEIFSPNSNRYPVLPVKLEDGKVLFPVGNLKGSWSHVELRAAIAENYVVTKVIKTHYYKETCSPFKEFIEDLYNKRLIMQMEENPMQEVIKLCMNGLYGKFGQRFINMENTIPSGVVDEKFLMKNTIKETLGDGRFVRYNQLETSPSVYCIPIWAVYVTAYARLRLYGYLKKYDPVYCDTDSIITDQFIEDSKELGKMKLVMTINEGVIVKPKFYAVQGISNGKEIEEVKIKGFSRALKYLEIAGEEIILAGRKKMFLNYLEFKGFLLNPTVRYNKFAKFKEALRRFLLPNEEILVKKEFNLEDNKRMWTDKFRIMEFQDSRPIIVRMR